MGIGGGSSMDAAKVNLYMIETITILQTVQVAAFMCGDTQQSLADVYGVGLTRGRRLPLIQVTSPDVRRTTLTILCTPGAHHLRHRERGDQHQRHHHRPGGEERCCGSPALR